MLAGNIKLAVALFALLTCCASTPAGPTNDARSGVHTSDGPAPIRERSKDRSTKDPLPDNGESTYVVPRSEQDAVEQLIAEFERLTGGPLDFDYFLEAPTCLSLGTESHSGPGVSGFACHVVYGFIEAGLSMRFRFDMVDGESITDRDRLFSCLGRADSCKFKSWPADALNYCSQSELYDGGVDVGLDFNREEGRFFWRVYLKKDSGLGYIPGCEFSAHYLQ